MRRRCATRATWEKEGTEKGCANWTGFATGWKTDRSRQTNKGNKGKNWSNANNPNNPNNPNYSNKGNKGNKGKNWSNANNPNNPNNPYYPNKGNKGNMGKNWSNANNPNKVPGWQANKVKHFNLPTKTTPTKVAAVNFQQGKHIEGSQNWQGPSYTVFRNYTPQWHDQVWWKSHHNRIVFVYGGWYAWNAGFWFPAWGYAPNAYYAYDGPIYGYNGLPPDQVIANVQTALQQQGYYQGEVDGLLGPQTRAAVADYQRANGLAETAAVDQPTLESLGMS